MRNATDLLKKLTVLSLVGLVMFMMWGCLDDPVSDDDSVVVTLGAIDSMVVGVKTSVTGTITASPAIDETGVTISLTDASGTSVVTTYFTQTGPGSITAADEIDIAADLGLAYTPTASVVTGTYTLTISATAGTATASDVETFTVTNVVIDPDTLVPKQITLGSWQNSTLGSSLEADSMLVYLSADAATISAEIDVWYSNEADGSNAFYSPAQAATIQHPPENWAVKNQTLMAIVTADFDATTKQSEVDAIWAAVATADKKQLIRPTANQVFVLETNNGNARLVKFISGDGTNTGTAVIKGKK